MSRALPSGAYRPAVLWVSGSLARRQLPPGEEQASGPPSWATGHAPQGMGTSMVTRFMGRSFGQMTF